ncbi:MAG: hypothetical protein MRZ13_03390 [Clostridiales bacterium]|nr:hypothetical protein [Clostridiales bacterium]MDY4894962.1 hypothetical protein [Christensenellaceae bacterium]
MKKNISSLCLCPCCRNEMPPEKSYYCPDCGDRVCDLCAKQNGGLCRRCFSPLTRLS